MTDSKMFKFSACEAFRTRAGMLNKGYLGTISASIKSMGGILLFVDFGSASYS